MENDHEVKSNPSSWSFIIAFYMVLLTVFVIRPFVHEYYGNIFLKVSMFTIMVFMLYILRHDKTMLLLTSIPTVLLLYTDAIAAFEHSIFYMAVNQVLLITFFGLICYYISRQTMRSNVIGTNLILGVVMLYLLVGMVWARLYWLTELFIPNSFRGLGPLAFTTNLEDALTIQQDLFFLSYSVQTGIGFADFVPASPIARSLVNLQGIFGQIFVATTIGKVVSVWRPYHKGEVKPKTSK